MDRFDIRFEHQDTSYTTTIAIDPAMSQYIVTQITPRYPGLSTREIPFDIVSNGLDYRTETDWDFMHALITGLRAHLKDSGSPFV